VGCADWSFGEEMRGGLTQAGRPSGVWIPGVRREERLEENCANVVEEACEERGKFRSRRSSDFRRPLVQL
jgi:hypothetical protein